MSAFELSELDRQRRQANKLYLEFLRVPGLSLGLYVLPPGGTDTQQPHGEDEVYHVIRGHGCFRLGEDDRAVQPGSILFAPAGEPRSEEHTSELQSRRDPVCRPLLEKKKFFCLLKDSGFILAAVIFQTWVWDMV